MRVVLDLGMVKDIAEVTVNGHTYPALWCPPYKVDITDAMQRFGDSRQSSNSRKSSLTRISGDSSHAIDIEIKVTNLWPNRLIGDARLPDDCEWDDGSKSKGFPLVKFWPDWFKAGKKSPTGRHAFCTCRFWSADAPLLPSGLLGPVTVQYHALPKATD